MFQLYAIQAYAKKFLKHFNRPQDPNCWYPRKRSYICLFSFQVTEIFSQRCRNKEMLVFEIPFTIKKSGTFISLDNDPHFRETQYLIKLITSPIILIQPIYTCISQLVSQVCDVDICMNVINGDTYTLFQCLSLCFY